MVVTTSENGDPKRRAVNLEVDLYCRDWSLTDMVPILIQNLYESHSVEFENEVNLSDMSWNSRATKPELPRISSRKSSPLPRVSSRGSSRVSSRAPSRAGSDDDEWAYSGKDESIPWYPRF